MLFLKLSLLNTFLLAVCGILALQTAGYSQTKESKLILTMERTGCLGRCPVYTLNIQSNGKLVFNGLRNTETHGKTEINLSKEKTNQIINEINKAKFFNLKDSYDRYSGNCPSMVTDHPTVTISIELNERKKTIVHYLGCRERSRNNDPFTLGKVFPQSLFNLEDKIDEIIETKRWVEK